MKSNSRQVKKVGAVTQQKTNKRKRFNAQVQSSQYLRDVIYQSSSSSSSESPKMKPIKFQAKREIPIASKEPEVQRSYSPDNSYDESSYGDSQYGINDATAQKSKRLQHSSVFQHHASKLSNHQATLQELNETIDEPKQSQISQFHLTKTPKMAIEIAKRQNKTNNRKKMEAQANEGRQVKGLQFIKLQNPNTNASQERRYPYRISREVPILKYWQGQKMDLKRNGYWRKST